MIQTNLIEELHTISSHRNKWTELLTVAELESTLLIKYGNREVYSAYFDLDSDEVAFHLYFAYNNKWEKLFHSLEQLDDIPLHSHHVSETVEDDTDVSEQKNISSQVQKEQGYNVDGWIETEGNEDSQTTESTRDRGTTRTSFQGSLSNVRNNIDRVQQIQLQEVICKDIANSLCLSIY